MNKQNNFIEKPNLFRKIKSWIYSLFHKSQMNDINKIEEITATELNEFKDNYRENNYFGELRQKNERHQYLLNLQRKYKNKEILERDMSQEDRIDLENLYIEQNSELKRKIRSIDSKIAKASGK